MEALYIPTSLLAQIRRGTVTKGGARVAPGADGEYEGFLAKSLGTRTFGATAAAGARRAGGADAWIEGPTLPSGTSRVVVEMDVAYEDNAAATSGALVVSVGSLDFRARWDPRSTKKQYEFRARSADGTNTATIFSALEVVQPGQRHVWKGVAQLKPASGDGLVRQFVGGAQSGTSAVTAGTGTFSTAGTIRFGFDTWLGLTLYGLKVWADTGTGDATPTGAPLFSVPGDPAVINAAAYKKGAGLFTAPA